MSGTETLRRSALVLTALVCLAATPAKTQPKAVRIFLGCITENFETTDEVSVTFDDAVSLATSQCGNLRPAAIDAIQNRWRAAHRDYADEQSQAYLDKLLAGRVQPLWVRHHGSQ